MGTCPRSFVSLLFSVPLLVGCPGGEGNGDDIGPQPCSDPEILTVETTIDSPAELNGLAEFTTAEAPIRFLGDQLTTVTGAQCMESANTISFRDTTQLSEVAAFPSLATLTMNLDFQRNMVLSTVSGFSRLSQIGGTLTLADLPALTDLSGFSAVTATAGLDVRNNPLLVDLNGLGGIRAVRGNFLLRDNPALVDLSALQLLERVASKFSIANNAMLSAVEGFALLDEVAILEIMDNAALVRVTGFPALLEIETLHLENNPALTDISAFETLQAASVVRVQGLGITDLSDLASLAVIDSQLRISGNSDLTSLDGLEQLQTVPALVIQDNPRLPNCEIQAFIDRLDPRPMTELISGNMEDSCGP